jgi:hypothetical protein
MKKCINFFDARFYLASLEFEKLVKKQRDTGLNEAEDTYAWKCLKGGWNNSAPGLSLRVALREQMVFHERDGGSNGAERE